MRIRSKDTLELATSHQPAPTIEVDLASIPEGESLQSLLCDALFVIHAEAASTLHVYFTPSVNFHEPTQSVFVMALGGKNALEKIHERLERVPGLRMRYSDYVAPSRGTPFAHLEDGTVWRPLDEENWYADVEHLIPESSEVMDDDYDDEDDDIGAEWDAFADDSDAKDGNATRTRAPARTRAARSDASIGTIARTIERLFALPEGSVLLCGPDKRALRRDARIGTLRRRWE